MDDCLCCGNQNGNVKDQTRAIRKKIKENQK